jgi:hypothetical protein
MKEGKLFLSQESFEKRLSLRSLVPCLFLSRALLYSDLTTYLFILFIMFSKVLLVAALFGVVANASSSSSVMDSSSDADVCDIGAADTCVMDLTIPSDCTTVECVCDVFSPYYNAAIDCYDGCEDDATGSVSIEEYETAISDLEDSYDCDDASAVAFSAATTLAVVVGAAMLN